MLRETHGKVILLIRHSGLTIAGPSSGFPIGVENMGGGALQNMMGRVKSIHGWSMAELKMLLKNTSEGVHLIVKLLAISLQACKFTKNELHTYFSRILARF